MDGVNDSIEGVRFYGNRDATQLVHTLFIRIVWRQLRLRNTFLLFVRRCPVFIEHTIAEPLHA